jgi:N-acetylneuraminic acid mutarotase
VGDAGADRPPADAAPLRGDGATAGDPAAGEYGARSTLLEPNSEMAVATVGTRLYVLGGYPSTRIAVNTLQVYDATTDKWTRGKSYPITIHHPVTVGLHGKLYSLGGQINLNNDGDTGRSFVYDPATDDWRELSRMPTARGGGGGAAIGNKIYVAGGRPPAGNAFEVYDVEQNTWATLPRLPMRIDNRNHIAVAAIGGNIYVAGGRYNGGGFGDPRTDALEMFDPATNVWTTKKPMLRPRGGMSSAVAFGCFHVYGGEGQGIGEPNDVYPDHDVYDPRTDTWTALKRLPAPFHGVTGGAFIDGIIYMPGGGTRSGGSSGSVMHQTYRPAMRCE